MLLEASWPGTRLGAVGSQPHDCDIRIIFNVVSDTIFLCDIVINFRTGETRGQEKAIWSRILSQNLGQSPQKFPFPGFKESDDSAEVILEPRLIAVEYIFNYYFFIT